MSKTFWEKQVTCPLCSNKFPTKNVRQGSYEVLKRDTDFCVWYKGANPMLYNVYICQNCGFAATSEDFEKMDRRAIARIAPAFQPKPPENDFTGLRSPELAIKANLHAINSYKLREANMALLAGLYLRIAWLYRQEGNQQQEMQYMTLARDAYKVAYENARDLPAKLGDIGVAYLIGELSRRLGENNASVRWFNVAISNKNIKKRPDLEKLARAQWQAAREGYVDRYETGAGRVNSTVPNLTQEELKELAVYLSVRKLPDNTLIKSLEAKIATFTRSKYVIVVNTAENAFQIVLDVLGIKENDEVILPAMSPYFAANMLKRRGCEIIFTDVSQNSLCIDTSKIPQLINQNTKCLVAVNWAGMVCNLSNITNEMKSKGIPIVELALETIGAKFEGESVTSKFADFTVLDFKMGHLNSTEGAAIVTNNDNFGQKIKLFSQEGVASIDDSVYRGFDKEPKITGINGTISELSAKMINMQLVKLDSLINKSKSYHDMYVDSFKKNEKITLLNDIQSYSSFPIIINSDSLNIDNILKTFTKNKIQVKKFPPPLSDFNLYMKKEQNIFPNAGRIHKNALILPLNASMTQMDVEKVVSTVNEALK